SNDNKTYDNFIKFHYTNQDLIEYPIINDNIFRKSPNVLFIAKDFSPENKYFANLSETYDLDQINIENLNLYDTIVLNKGPNKTYLLVSHLNYFDSPDSKDIFYSFLNLSKKIDQSETKLFIQNPLYFNPKLKSYIISEMLSYIFDNKLETTFVDLEK